MYNVQYRDREAAAKPKKEMQQKEARDSEQKRQSKDRDKLARLEKDYARSVLRMSLVQC